MNTTTLRRLLAVLIGTFTCFVAPALAASTLELLPADAPLGARFGASIGLGDNTLVVGAPDDHQLNPFAGAAYIYTRQGTAWRLHSKLTGPATEGYRAFGEAVAISRDVILIGAPFETGAAESSGAAYVFMHNGSGWKQQARLAPADPAVNQLFGDAVAIDGSTVVVGAFLDSERAPNAGAVYVFTRSGVKWTQRAKLTASDASAYGFFGSSVAIRGNTIVVGAPIAEAAYVFELESGHWTERKILRPNSVPGDYTAFGTSVAIDSNRIAVGAPLQSSTALKTGTVYTFKLSGKNWVTNGSVTAPDVFEGDEFGTSVALCDTRLVIGAPFKGEHAQGAVYTCDYSSGKWRSPVKHLANASGFSALYGASVALTRTHVAGGAPSFYEFAGDGSAGAVFLRSLR